MSSSGALCAWVAVMLCASAAVAGQGATAPVGGSTTAAQTAGDYSAFRFLLRARNDACYLTPSDNKEQDDAAQRLYFGLYNPAYSSPNDPGARQFFPQMTQRQDAVLKAPGDYDLSGACQAVQNEVRAFHPHASTDTLKDVASWCNSFKQNACWCAAPDFNPPQPPCGGQSPAQSWTPNSRWQSQAHRTSLELANLTVYADFCYGRSMDAIIFLPRTTGAPTAPQNSQSRPACDASNVHIRQFVYTRCVGSFQQCGKTYSSTCGERNFYTWYLDECSAERHLTPDVVMGGAHVITDEPTANLPETGAALEKQFVDVVVCGEGENTQVLDAFRWTRTGTEAQPQWCAVYPKNPKDRVAPRLRSAPYSDLRQLDPRNDTHVRDAVCGAVDNMHSGDLGLVAITRGLCPGGL